MEKPVELTDFPTSFVSKGSVRRGFNDQDDLSLDFIRRTAEKSFSKQFIFSSSEKYSEVIKHTHSVLGSNEKWKVFFIWCFLCLI